VTSHVLPQRLPTGEAIPAALHLALVFHALICQGDV
jgi:hypothetical protein